MFVSLDDLLVHRVAGGFSGVMMFTVLLDGFELIDEILDVSGELDPVAEAAQRRGDLQNDRAAHAQEADRAAFAVRRRWRAAVARRMPVDWRGSR